MTIVSQPVSQTICQKSSIVLDSGPIYNKKKNSDKNVSNGNSLDHYKEKYAIFNWQMSTIMTNPLVNPLHENSVGKISEYTCY